MIRRSNTIDKLTNHVTTLTCGGGGSLNKMSDPAAGRKKGASKKTNPVSFNPASQKDVDKFFGQRRRPPKRKATDQPGPSNVGRAPVGDPSEPKIARVCPLPELTWANKKDVWESMIKRERKHRIDITILDRHKEISPRMRSVLIDWLIEVSEVYRLHRETLYMAVNYVDRYLSRQSSPTRKSELQLIGVSALFFAAKLEEIYPPKLAEFAYVTDSACTEIEMREMELMMLKKLQWELSPPTAIQWLNLYLQAAQLPLTTDFILPSYPQETFVQIAQLLDLCMMDIGSLRFTPSALAAACLYHFSSEDLALECSGFKLSEISPAIRWVTPFAMTIRDQGLASLRSFRKVSAEDAHNIQTHINSIATLEKAQYRQLQTSPTKNSTPNSKVGTPITPAEVGTPMSNHQISETPERKVIIDTSSSESSSPVSQEPEKTRNPTVIGISSSSPDRNFGTSPFKNSSPISEKSKNSKSDSKSESVSEEPAASPAASLGEDLLLSSNSDNPTYVASPNHSSQLSLDSGSSPSSSVLRSSPQI